MTKLKLSVFLFAGLISTTGALAAERQEGMTGTVRAIGQFPGIYLIPGVSDNGGAANSGVASSFHCSNPTPFSAQIQVVAWSWNGIVKANVTVTLPKLFTFTFSTHPTVIYFDDVNLATGLLNQGFVKIYANNGNIVCSAHTLDASPNKSFEGSLNIRSTAGD